MLTSWRSFQIALPFKLFFLRQFPIIRISKIRQTTNFGISFSKLVKFFLFYPPKRKSRRDLVVKHFRNKLNTCSKLKKLGAVCFPLSCIVTKFIKKIKRSVYYRECPYNKRRTITSSVMFVSFFKQ